MRTVDQFLDQRLKRIRHVLILYGRRIVFHDYSFDLLKCRVVIGEPRTSRVLARLSRVMFGATSPERRICLREEEVISCGLGIEQIA